tara:strand:+ start:1508 stop:1861 length:354 start_codon:yes stop_codon:yes gene_type:complete
LKFKIINLFIIFIFYSCVPTPSNRLYYWGDYSNSLYNYKRALTQESLDLYIAELYKIIEKSNEFNLRVPPGVYAELGFYYAEQNNNNQAIKYFTLEKNTYPEATKLMDSLITNLNTN